jgi:hypothetical protein
MITFKTNWRKIIVDKINKHLKKNKLTEINYIFFMITSNPTEF